MKIFIVLFFLGLLMPPTAETSTTSSATANIVEDAPNTSFGHYTLSSGNGSVINFEPCGSFTCAGVESVVAIFNAIHGTSIQVTDCNDCTGPDGPTFNPGGPHEHPVYDATGQDIEDVILNHVKNGTL